MLGEFLAIGITGLYAWISFEFVDRGRLIKRTEFGRGIHAHDSIVNVMTGLLIAVSGCAVGAIGRRHQFPRPLTVGAVPGSTLLGSFFVLGNIGGLLATR